MTEPAKKAAAANKAEPAKKAVPAKKVAGARTSAPAKKAAPAKKVAGARKGAPAKNADLGNNAAASMRDKADSAPASRFFKRATDRARRISSDPDKLREIAEKANRSSALRSGPFAAVLDDFRALIRLVVAYARGLYRQIPMNRLIIVVGGLIYVVSPVDVIPDPIPVAGFLDDATVIAWVIKAVREELDAFRLWESGVTD